MKWCVMALLLSGCASTPTYKPDVEIGSLYQHCLGDRTQDYKSGCMYGVTITHEAYEGEIDRKSLYEDAMSIVNENEPDYRPGIERNSVGL